MIEYPIVPEELKERIKKDIMMNDDGYYVFWPDRMIGYLDEYYLACIYQVLKEMNKEWDEIVQRDASI